MDDSLFVEDCMKADCEDQLRDKDARIAELTAVAKLVDQWGNGLRHPTAHEIKMVSAARAALVL